MTKIFITFALQNPKLIFRASFTLILKLRLQ